MTPQPLSSLTLRDQAVEFTLPVDVHVLDGFVENEQFGVAQQGAGEQDALALSAGEALDGMIQKVSRADFIEALLHPPGGSPSA